MLMQVDQARRRLVPQRVFFSFLAVGAVKLRAGGKTWLSDEADSEFPPVKPKSLSGHFI